MIVSFLIACAYAFVDTGISGEWQLISGVVITTIAWMATALSTKPTDTETLTHFYQTIKPHATGWRKFLMANKVAEIPTSGFSRELLCMFAGVFLVYGTLFGTGYLLYGRIVPALVGLSVAVISALVVMKNWKAATD